MSRKGERKAHNAHKKYLNLEIEAYTILFTRQGKGGELEGRSPEE